MEVRSVGLPWEHRCTSDWLPHCWTDAIIIDGAAVVQMLHPGQCRNFADYADKVFVSRVRQGWILSPFLFIIVIDFVMRKTMDKSEYGIVWQKRNRLTDLNFVDDIAIVTEEENVCQMGWNMQQKRMKMKKEGKKRKWQFKLDPPNKISTKKSVLGDSKTT